MPGALTPSVQSKAVLRFAGRNLTTSIAGNDPRTEGDVSKLAAPIRQGTLKSLYRASNALLVDLVGAVLGWALGYLLTRGLASLEFKTTFSDFNHLPVLYSPKHYLLATGVALISSLVAGYFPARAAARLNPVDIIRGAT